MASFRDPRKKGGAPAQVLFFPKREMGRRGTPFEFISPAARTLPEVRLPFQTQTQEIATEPHFFPHFEQTDPHDVRAASGASGRKETPRRSRKVTRTDETVAPYQGLTRAQEKEVSLFGHKLYESGRHEEARQVFEGLVASGVRDAFPHTMLGTLYLARKDRDRALALFEMALVIDSKDLAARVYRGEIRLHRGQVKKAIEDLEWARSVGPRGDAFTERAKRVLKMIEEARKKSRSSDEITKSK